MGTYSEKDLLTSSETPVDRRAYMKLLGAASASVVGLQTVNSSRAATSDSGYGYGGYGEGGYGTSSTDSTLSVRTDDATDVTESSATLTGTLTDLGSASSAEVSFDYRPAGAGSDAWVATSSQSLSATGSFSLTVEELESDTEYEFRAVADASDEDQTLGTAAFFTTRAAAQGPVVDRITLSEKGRPNPHAQLRAEWVVSDEDGNLETVEFSVEDERGSEVESTTVSVGGSSASDTESFKITHGAGETYTCRITVVDSDSQTDSSADSTTA